MKKNQKITMRNWLDLETLGSRPVMLKNLPGQCYWGDESMNESMSELYTYDTEHVACIYFV